MAEDIYITEGLVDNIPIPEGWLVLNRCNNTVYLQPGDMVFYGKNEGFQDCVSNQIGDDVKDYMCAIRKIKENKPVNHTGEWTDKIKRIALGIDK